MVIFRKFDLKRSGDVFTAEYRAEENRRDEPLFVENVMTATALPRENDYKMPTVVLTDEFGCEVHREKSYKFLTASNAIGKNRIEKWMRDAMSEILDAQFKCMREKMEEQRLAAIAAQPPIDNSKLLRKAEYEINVANEEATAARDRLTNNTALCHSTMGNIIESQAVATVVNVIVEAIRKFTDDGHIEREHRLNALFARLDVEYERAMDDALRTSSNSMSNEIGRVVAKAWKDVYKNGFGRHYLSRTIIEYAWDKGEDC